MSDAVLFWRRGNDGLTYWKRRRLARQWRRGSGGIPSRKASLRALRHLTGESKS